MVTPSYIGKRSASGDAGRTARFDDGVAATYLADTEEIDGQREAARHALSLIEWQTTRRPPW